MKKSLFTAVLSVLVTLCVAQNPKVMFAGQSSGLIGCSRLQEGLFTVAGEQGWVISSVLRVRIDGYTHQCPGYGRKLTPEQLALAAQACPGERLQFDVRVRLNDGSLATAAPLFLTKDGTCLDALRTLHQDEPLKERLRTHPFLYVYPSLLAADTADCTLVSFLFRAFPSDSPVVEIRGEGRVLTPEMLSLMEQSAAPCTICPLEIAGCNTDCRQVGRLTIRPE